MKSLLTEVVRFANFLNHRPNLEELLSRLATDFLVHLKPQTLAVASLISTSKFKVLHEIGESKNKSELTLDGLASDFFTDNLVEALIDQNLLKHPKNNKTLITPITNGKVASGVVLCDCDKPPTEEETEQAKALLLLTSSYLFPKVSNDGQSSSLTELTVNPLTPRQRQVLAGFIEGKTNHELALELGFSISTIRHETMAIFKTLGASDRKEAAKIAQKHGLI
jgi:DNA-binding CsgD family transcriptional regulator